MVTVEFTKKFITGRLKGIRIVERITTSFPECFEVGVKREDSSGNLYIIINSIID